MDWSNTVAAVTGGTTGIGYAVVEALAARGARVAFCGRSEKSARTAETRLQSAERVAGFACDVRDEVEVARFADKVRRRFGAAPTLLVNNAGIAKWGKVAEMSAADFDDVMATNVRGMFLMTRALLPAMLEAGQGDIVNVASLAGRNGIAEGSAYSASKHAVLGFSKSLMLEVRRQGIRVIAICPGSVDTPIFDEPAPFDTHRARMMQPSDIAAAIVDALELDRRTMVSELDIRPTNP